MVTYFYFADVRWKPWQVFRDPYNEYVEIIEFDSNFKIRKSFGQSAVTWLDRSSDNLVFREFGSPREYFNLD